MCYSVEYEGSAIGVREDLYAGYDVCHAAVCNFGVAGDVTSSYEDE